MQLDLDELVRTGRMTAVGKYLAENLIAILKSRYGGGREPSRAWVYRNYDGQLAHTFNGEVREGRESWGGKPIPSDCLSRDETELFARRRGEVREYLKTFGRQDPEAETILQVVGSAA